MENTAKNLLIKKESDYCLTMIAKSEKTIQELEFHVAMERKNITHWTKRIDELKNPLTNHDKK